MHSYWQQIFAPEYYQGLGSRTQSPRTTYFEGWYFKHSCPQGTLALIPGIALAQGCTKAFIQYIFQQGTYQRSGCVDFPADSFYANPHRLYINIDGNEFSTQGIGLSLLDPEFSLICDLQYGTFTPLHKSILRPSIMGPFAYVPQLECNHGLISLQHPVSGTLRAGHCQINFRKDPGYIEKDWGTSFPRDYLWLQGNHFNHPAAFFFSAARIPWGRRHFKGLICLLDLEGQPYLFATYNRAKAEILEYTPHWVHLQIYRAHWELEIIAHCQDTMTLAAPALGKMNRRIQEGLEGTLQLRLTHKHRLIYEGKGSQSGYEQVGNPFI